MSTRTRQTRPLQESFEFEDFDERLDLDSLSDEELEAMLFEEEKSDTSKGLFNLPTVAGLSIIVVGIAYLFQQLGIWVGLPSLSTLAAMLPWLAGILIILLGFGVLSWRPSKKKKKAVKTVKKDVKAKSGEKFTVEAGRAGAEQKKRLRKSIRDKKIAGVCGGLGEYFNIDPTIIRIAFVIGTLFNGVGILVYLALAFIMNKPESLSAEERITIIRDS